MSTCQVLLLIWQVLHMHRRSYNLICCVLQLDGHCTHLTQKVVSAEPFPIHLKGTPYEARLSCSGSLNSENSDGTCTDTF